MRRAGSLEDWWQALRGAAEEMNFSRLKIVVPQPDGSTQELLWEHPGSEPSQHETLSLLVPICGSYDGGPLRAHIDMPVNGSLELAGRRVSLFGRLIDEHPIGGLPCEERSGDQPAAESQET